MTPMNALADRYLYWNLLKEAKAKTAKGPRCFRRVFANQTEPSPEYKRPNDGADRRDLNDRRESTATGNRCKSGPKLHIGGETVIGNETATPSGYQHGTDALQI